MCICCASGDPVTSPEAKGYDHNLGTTRHGYKNPWSPDGNEALNAICFSPCVTILSLPPVLAQFFMCNLRNTVLDEKMDDYKCCQGYYDPYMGNCAQSGKWSEKNCPCCCMATETLLCPGLALATARFTAMDKLQLQPDACDNRVMRVTNTWSCCVAMCAPCCCLLTGEACSGHKALRLICDHSYLCAYGCVIAQTLDTYNRLGNAVQFDPSTGGAPAAGAVYAKPVENQQAAAGAPMAQPYGQQQQGAQQQGPMQQMMGKGKGVMSSVKQSMQKK